VNISGSVNVRDPNQANPPGTIGQPQIVVDSRGNPSILFQDTTNGLYLVTSSDAGLTFTDPRALQAMTYSNGTTSSSIPSPVGQTEVEFKIDSSDRIHMAYYFNSGFLKAQYLQTRDGGSTFYGQSYGSLLAPPLINVMSLPAKPLVVFGDNNDVYIMSRDLIAGNNVVTTNGFSRGEVTLPMPTDTTTGNQQYNAYDMVFDSQKTLQVLLARQNPSVNLDYRSVASGLSASNVQSGFIALASPVSVIRTAADAAGNLHVALLESGILPTGPNYTATLVYALISHENSTISAAYVQTLSSAAGSPEITMDATQSNPIISYTAIENGVLVPKVAVSASGGRTFTTYSVPASAGRNVGVGSLVPYRMAGSTVVDGEGNVGIFFLGAVDIVKYAYKGAGDTAFTVSSHFLPTSPFTAYPFHMILY
jgi:hypothetical protein